MLSWRRSGIWECASGQFEGALGKLVKAEGQGKRRV